MPYRTSRVKILVSAEFEKLRQCGPIAQSVEQMAFNHWVEGSSPSRITIFESLIDVGKPASFFVSLEDRLTMELLFY